MKGWTLESIKNLEKTGMVSIAAEEIAELSISDGQISTIEEKTATDTARTKHAKKGIKNDKKHGEQKGRYLTSYRKAAGK